MHMHQQKHWNRVLFYWYQSYHWYQWTISLTNRIRLCLLDMCAPHPPFLELMFMKLFRYTLENMEVEYPISKNSST